MLDSKVISKEAIKKYKKELEEKYLWAITNIQNIKTMISNFEKEYNLLTMEEITKMKDWQEKNDAKTAFMAYEWLQKQLKDNNEALEMHKNNILFLNESLWV